MKSELGDDYLLVTLSIFVQKGDNGKFFELRYGELLRDDIILVMKRICAYITNFA